MRYLKEPVVQFLLIGGLLFAAWSLFAPAGEVARERIVVDASVRDSLDQGFETVWKRPPSEEERKGLVEDYLAEEVLYREAQKLGLDQDDVVVRRRLRQKMEFLLQDSLALVPASDEELRAYFESRRERYRNPELVTFRQVFLGQAPGNEGKALLVQLNGSDPPDPAEVGQGTLLPHAMVAASEDAIERTFGGSFALRLRSVAPGRWSGPVPSAYGLHLVEVEGRAESAAPSFAEVRAAVERDFRVDQQRKAESALIERLKQNYEIVVDGAEK